MKKAAPSHRWRRKAAATLRHVPGLKALVNFKQIQGVGPSGPTTGSRLSERLQPLKRNIPAGR